MADNIIRFFHGEQAKIQEQIDKGTIDSSDFVVTTDDELVYIDADKAQKPLGSAKSKQDYTVNLGGGTVGSLKDGDVIPAGTNLDELIKKLTQKSVPAKYTAPSVAVRVSAGNGAGNYEVGTEIKTTIQATFAKNDAGALETLKINQDGQEILSETTSPATTDEITFTLEEKTVNFNAVATYGEGAIKNDNLGSPSPNGHIMAGSKTSGNVSFTGKRNLFYGTGVGAAPEATSEMVRALANKKLAPANGTTFTVNIATGQQYVVIAYPATLRDMTKCFYVEQNTDMAANFTKSTISVQGANGAAGADYKVFAYSMAVPAAGAMTFNVTI